MTSQKSPLSKTFDLSSENDLETLSEFLAVEVPDDPNLKDIAKLALEAYKEQLKIVNMIEPKYRARYLEVAKGFLDTAKESLASLEDVQIKNDKLTLDRSKAFPDKDKKENSERKFDRKELLTELDQARRKKQQTG